MHQQASLATEELSNPQRQPSYCSSTFTTQFGLPCQHLIRDYREDDKILQLDNFNEHWWLKAYTDDQQALLDRSFEPDPDTIRPNNSRLPPPPEARTGRILSGFEAFERQQGRGTSMSPASSSSRGGVSSSSSSTTTSSRGRGRRRGRDAVAIASLTNEVQQLRQMLQEQQQQQAVPTASQASSIASISLPRPWPQPPPLPSTPPQALWPTANSHPIASYPTAPPLAQQGSRWIAGGTTQYTEVNYSIQQYNNSPMPSQVVPRGSQTPSQSELRWRQWHPPPGT